MLSSQVQQHEFLRILDMLTDLASQLSLYKLLGYKANLSWNLIFLNGDVVLIELDLEHQHLILSSVLSKAEAATHEMQTLALKFNALWRENNNAFLGLEDSNQLILFSKLSCSNMLYPIFKTNL